MKNNHSRIIANDDLCNYFATSAKARTLSHAYILLGAKGMGKHTLARYIAAAVNCDNKENGDADVPCFECNSCKKITDGISADVVTVSREKDRASLGVEPIRFVKSDVAIYPNDGDYKVYIIEDAHTMTVQAQNALLLTLEEPPPYVIFVLLCEHTENILETIKSRAPVLRIKTPSEEETIEFLKANYPSARTFINSSQEDFKQIYLASGGSIGRILELISSSEKKQVLQDRMLAIKLIDAIANNSLARDLAELSSMFAQKREDRERLISQLAEIQMALRDLMVIKKAEEPKMVFFTSLEQAEELSYSFSTQRIAEIIESLEKTRLALQRNANVKLTIVNFLSGLI